MEWTGLNELREEFLSFFESKGHMRLESAALIPKDDNSLLLINSGMAPLKKYFLGLAKPPKTRVTTCQKCIRTPDIERVGKTARHGTYFEMLGNFSFGDYFKHEATAWAWEFVTKRMKMPVDRLWVTIYQDDDEAFDIWTKEVGVSPERIVRLGKEDNFWEHGTGPCGPCSEIHFDRGEQYGCGKPGCAVGCDCDRYVEFWNLVFTQFDRNDAGEYIPLAKPNIDTGMGLERLACIMQGVDNLFEVDTVRNIMKHIEQIAGIKYKNDAKADVSLRVITDHIRSTVFMVGDGVVPQNEGRGYVLRRLLRRAARHGRLLGINEPFLYKVCATVIEENKTAYPELVEKAEYIAKIIMVEEERFAKTIDQGMSQLTEITESLKASGGSVISGEDAFRLYDTYGFPLDLTVDIVSEQGITVDEEGFTECMKQQRERARAARSDSDKNAWSKERELEFAFAKTEFTGYTENVSAAKVMAIVADEPVGSAVCGDEVLVVLDRTPFYAESGGQVGDCGVISSKTARLEISDCKKTVSGHFVHVAKVTQGTLIVGDEVNAEIDVKRRNAIRRNHTSAHLLQAALREVLGEHVHQAGSYVDEYRVRFDFSHFNALSSDEIAAVENKVNDAILDAIPVDSNVMSIEEARKLGAMALFGEKYGKQVRVVSVQGVSSEFCGGTHADNTAKLALFKILSESSVAAGVRRIEGTTGEGVLKYIGECDDLLARTASAMKITNVSEIPSKVKLLGVQLKERAKEIEALNRKISEGKFADVTKNAENIDGITVFSAKLNDVAIDAARDIWAGISDNNDPCIALFAISNDGKTNLMVGCSKTAVQLGFVAGALVKQAAAIAGGSGGGKPDLAMAGIKELSKVDDVLAAFTGLIKQ